MRIAFADVIWAEWMRYYAPWTDYEPGVFQDFYEMMWMGRGRS